MQKKCKKYFLNKNENDLKRENLMILACKENEYFLIIWRLFFYDEDEEFALHFMSGVQL